MRYGIAQCYLPPGRADISAFTPAKLVLDLATPEGCKAEHNNNSDLINQAKVYYQLIKTYS